MTGQDDIYALVRQAQMLAAAGRLPEAADCWRQVVRLQPDLAAAHNNLGSTLRLLGQHETAADCFRAALRLDMDYPEACNNLGTTLCDLGQLTTGEALLHRAVTLRPDYARAHYNLGKALQQQGRVDAAAERFAVALTHQPDLAEAHLHLGYALLLDGHMPEAWAEFEWRLRLPGKIAVRNDAPMWRGEPLTGRSLLIHAEEGFGDTIQFCRYIKLLAPIARLILRVPRPLVRLLRDLADDVAVIAADDPLPPSDLQCGLLSLPHIFATTLATIPAQSPYLHADPDHVLVWRHRLAGLSAVRVGLVWRGNPAYPDDRRRSIDPAMLVALAGVSGISFVSLQVGGYTPPAGLDIHDPTADLRDFADTAALIAALDLVIGVDTAVVHLAGALGKPVWLLNRFDTDWRWLRDRSDSPWYPTLRQFRQPVADDWASVVQAVRAALHDVPNRPGSAGDVAFQEGLGHHQARRLADAERCYRETLRLWPEHYPSLHQLGLIALECRRPDTAVTLFARAIRSHPDESSSVNNLGSAYRGIGASAEAVVCYQQALRLRPDDVEVLVNLANAHGDLCEIETGEAYARRAIALQPDLPNAHFALGWLLLTSGRLAEGWREHGWRRRMKDYVTRSFRGQEWQGEPPGDRLLLLHSDEGVGDAIQCVRYLPMLGASNIVLEVQPDLVRLFQGLPGVTSVLPIAIDDPPSGRLPVELHRPLLDLPGLLGTTLETIPADVPYLQADPALALKWHRRMEPVAGFRVGVAWAGNPANLADRTRSMAFTQLAPLFDAFPDVAFVSLQKGAASQQTGGPLHDFTGELTDFADTAALLQTLDLVIAVDTAAVHLAGALGLPVWLLNRFDTDWRWLLGRDDSPWYPTLRQFRQPEMGDWDDVVRQVAAALRQELAAY